MLLISTSLCEIEKTGYHVFISEFKRCADSDILFSFVTYCMFLLNIRTNSLQGWISPSGIILQLVPIVSSLCLTCPHVTWQQHIMNKDRPAVKVND